MHRLLLALIGLARAASVGPAMRPPVDITQTTATDVLAAADGTTWFATDAGVILRDRDGTWRMLEATFTGTPRDLTAAADGGVWVGDGRGLVGFGPDGAQRPGPDAENRADRPPVVQVMPDGTTWASYSGIELFVRDVAGAWRRYPREMEVSSFALAPDGTLHAAGRKGRFVLAPGAQTWVATQDITDVNTNAMAVAADGGVWERDRTGGLVRFDGNADPKVGTGRVRAVVATTEGVWALGIGRVYEANGARLVEHRLPGEVGSANALALAVTASHHVWVATERGLLTLKRTARGLEPTQATWWRFDVQRVSLAPYPGRDDAVWAATSEGVFAVDAAGNVLEAHRHPTDAPLDPRAGLRTGPDGRLWSGGPGAIGRVDLERGTSALLWGRSGPLAFGADGAAWSAYGRTLTRIDAATGALTHIPMPKYARVVDARPDVVRVLGASETFPYTMDWHLKEQRWSAVTDMEPSVREALYGALGPPLRLGDGAAWWPTGTGFVRETADGDWTVHPAPEGAGRLSDALVVGGVVYAAAAHGVWRMDADGTLARVDRFGEDGGVALAACGATLWAGTDAALYEVRDGASIRRLPIDARPLACTDGALAVAAVDGVGHVDADGQVRWVRHQVSPQQGHDLSTTGPEPTRGPWVADDQAWLAAPDHLEALDRATGAQTRLGPASRYGRGTFDRDGALWRVNGRWIERWDPVAGRIERTDPWPAPPRNAVAWVRTLADGTLRVGAYEGRTAVRAPGASAFVPERESGRGPLAERDPIPPLGNLFVDGAQRWSARDTGLWRMDGDAWTQIVSGQARFVTPGRRGTWVGLEGDTQLVRIVGAAVVERIEGAVAGTSAVGVLEDRRGRLWLAGTGGVTMRDASGVWTRDGTPWQNGNRTPCPIAVERKDTARWVPTGGVVPLGVATPTGASADGFQIFHVEGRRYRTAVADWPALRDHWLRTTPYDREGPWTTEIEWMWEEADGGLRFVTRRPESDSDAPAVFALDDDRWRRARGPAMDIDSYSAALERIGGGRWLLTHDDGIVELGPDGAIRRHIRSAPQTVALAAEHGQAVVASRSFATARVGTTWQGRPDWGEVPVALDGGLLLTEVGSLIELHGERAWRAPMDWVTDVATVDGRPCVVGGGVQCVDPQTGAWTRHGGGALIDAAARGGTLWVAGLVGPDGTRGGVVCHGPDAWVCVDVPGIARAVSPDDHGGAWVGTTQGLVHVDAAGTVRTTTLTAPVTRLAAGATLLWVGTELDGLWTWDPARRRAEHLAAGAVHALAAEGEAAWAWMDEGVRALHE